MRALPGFFSNERVRVSIIARAPAVPPFVLSIAAAQAGDLLVDQPRVDGGEQRVEIGEALAEVAIP